MNRAHVLSLAASLALTALGGMSSGCSSDPPPPPKTAATPPASAATAAVAPTANAAKADTATPTSGSIQIDSKILKACGDIPEAHFAFDSASLDPKVEATLSALARCFVNGPLKGKGMNLVGHADLRGSPSYNRGLGQKRAGSVGSYLTSKGLETGRIATSSVGSDESTGTDEEGWAKDRKVEVFLAE